MQGPPSPTHAFSLRVCSNVGPNLLIGLRLYYRGPAAPGKGIDRRIRSNLLT